MIRILTFMPVLFFILFSCGGSDSISEDVDSITEELFYNSLSQISVPDTIDLGNGKAMQSYLAENQLIEKSELNKFIVFETFENGNLIKQEAYIDEDLIVLLKPGQLLSNFLAYLRTRIPQIRAANGESICNCELNAYLVNFQYTGSLRNIYEVLYEIVTSYSDENKSVEDGLNDIAQSVDFNHLYFFDSDEYFPNKQWGLKKSTGSYDVNAEAAWNIFTSKEMVKVAVIDSGIDLDHKDLQSSLSTGFNFNEIGECSPNVSVKYRAATSGYDFIESDGYAEDISGHGTRISGIIGAERDNGVGIAGLASGLEVIPLRVSRKSYVTLENLVCSLAMAYHIKDLFVINCSLSTKIKSAVVEVLITRLERKGILLVAAAGNSGSSIDYKLGARYPASFSNKNIISVAGLTPDGQKVGSSSYGPSSVDIGAPGVSIFSTSINNNYDGMLNLKHRGTSFAAPFVTAVCAMVKSNYPDMDANGVKECILNGAATASHLEKYIDRGRMLDAYGSLVYANGL